MSHTANDFLYEQYWDTYLLECRAEGKKPDLSDFQVWCDENVPEAQYEND